jgi:phosphatidylserine/phosphatidylglycerophosphate/cardiolipin synthase-like enzyme
LVVRDRTDVRRLAILFARLWALSLYDMPPNRAGHSVADRNPSPAPALAPPEGNGPLWTWPPEENLLHAAQELIGSAREELVLATFSIVGMTHPVSPRRPARPELLFEPVRDAVRRGVDVRLLLRGRNNGDAARNEAAAFADAGVRVFADRLTHAKGVIADGRRGALFSANFVVHKGLTGGIEVGMRLDGSDAVGEARRYFHHVMTETDLEFVRNPRTADLAGSLYADSFTGWPHRATLEVSVRPSDWTALAEQQGVALYETDPAGRLTVHSGRDRWRLSESGGSWTLTRLGGTAVDAAETLEDWLRNWPAEGVRRGLCPATLVRLSS